MHKTCSSCWRSHYLQNAPQPDEKNLLGGGSSLELGDGCVGCAAHPPSAQSNDPITESRRPPSSISHVTRELGFNFPIALYIIYHRGCSKRAGAVIQGVPLSLRDL
eukprot:sb/3477767/